VVFLAPSSLILALLEPISDHLVAQDRPQGTSKFVFSHELGF